MSIKSWTSDAMRDLAYLGAVGAWGLASLGLFTAGVSATASSLAFVVGVAVWLGFALALRATTTLDRRLAGWQRRESVPAAYRRPPARGFLPLLRTVTGDPQTWRDLGWVGLTSVVGSALGLLGLTVAATALYFVTMPLWYWAAREHTHALTGVASIQVDTIGEALTVSGIGLLLVPVALYLSRAFAAAHAGLAARVLGRQRPLDLVRPIAVLSS
jgi:hypothetical protein